MMFHYLKSNNHQIIFDPHCFNEISIDHFKSDYWHTQNKIIATRTGRGLATVFRHQEREYVLKHYHRGGWVAPIMQDNYLYSEFLRTRASREFELLAHLYQQDLPVPQPIAIHVERHGLYYHADLITRLIPNNQTLAIRLTQRPLSENEWHQIGATLFQFHQTGVYHADLNAHNILLDDHTKVWLIDFDKSYLRSAKLNWQQANLDRLQRSLRKLSHQQLTFHWKENYWKTLLAGYQQPKNTSSISVSKRWVAP